MSQALPEGNAAFVFHFDFVLDFILQNLSVCSNFVDFGLIILVKPSKLGVLKNIQKKNSDQDV